MLFHYMQNFLKCIENEKKKHDGDGKSNIKKHCLNDVIFFLVLAVMFSTAVLVQIQATWQFIVCVVLAYVVVALLSFVFIWKKIKTNYFDKKTKSKKVSMSFLFLVSTCSIFGIFIGRTLSLILEDDIMTIVLLFMTLVLSCIFISLSVYNLIAIYCFHKINKS